MCPYIGEEITGIIYRTYLRGQLVFSSEGSTPAGTILTRSNN